MENARKIVCYTAITGGYDKLKDPSAVSEGVDYVCFSDRPLESGIWKTRPMPAELDGLDRVKAQRVVKICPHRYLPEYGVSIWVDGNVRITGDLNEFLKQCDFSKSPLWVRPHPSRMCVYDEADAVIRYRKDDPALVGKVVARYRAEGYPEKAGMAETCVIARAHNDMKCRMFDEAWAAELLLNSRRDQLSFNYVARKAGLLPGYLTRQAKIDQNGYFRLERHG